MSAGRRGRHFNQQRRALGAIKPPAQPQKQKGGDFSVSALLRQKKRADAKNVSPEYCAPKVPCACAQSPGSAPCGSRRPFGRVLYFLSGPKSCVRGRKIRRRFSRGAAERAMGKPFPRPRAGQKGRRIAARTGGALPGAAQLKEGGASAVGSHFAQFMERSTARCQSV